MWNGCHVSLTVKLSACHGRVAFAGGSMYKMAVEAKANEEAAARVAADLQVCIIRIPTWWRLTCSC